MSSGIALRRVTSASWLRPNSNAAWPHRKLACASSLGEAAGCFLSTRACAAARRCSGVAAVRASPRAAPKCSGFLLRTFSYSERASGLPASSDARASTYCATSSLGRAAAYRCSGSSAAEALPSAIRARATTSWFSASPPSFPRAGSASLGLPLATAKSALARRRPATGFCEGLIACRSCSARAVLEGSSLWTRTSRSVISAALLRRASPSSCRGVMTCAS